MDDFTERMKVRVVRILLAPYPESGTRYEHKGSGVMLKVGQKAFVVFAAHSIPSRRIPPGYSFYVTHPKWAGVVRTAQFVRADFAQDVAVLFMPNLQLSEWPTLETAPVTQVQAGDEILHLGFPADAPGDAAATVIRTTALVAGFRDRSSNRMLLEGPRGGPYVNPPDDSFRPGLSRVLIVRGTPLPVGMSGGPAFSMSSRKFIGINQGFAELDGESARSLGVSEASLVSDVSQVLAELPTF